MTHNGIVYGFVAFCLATNLVNNYRPMVHLQGFSERKISSNELYTLLYAVFLLIILLVGGCIFLRLFVILIQTLLK